MADNEKCPNCGMDLSLARTPIERGGRTYCCEGCANQTGCTC